MSRYPQIYDAGERRLVALADIALTLWSAPGRLFGSRTRAAPLQRILLLRLERIGDLLMTVPAIEAVREQAPDAVIDLIVGRWNEAVARLLPGVNSVETMDLPWLARDGSSAGFLASIRQAAGWRVRRYDLGINFEPDIRSNLLLYVSGARRRVGFDVGGGGPLLTERAESNPARLTADNALSAVATAFRVPLDQLRARHLDPIERSGRRRFIPSDQARLRAAALIGQPPSPLVGIHAGGGRAIKQWPEERFGALAGLLASEHGAAIVLTGSPADRAIVDRVKKALPPRTEVLDLCGALDLVTLAAVVERLDLLISCDTGPMHLADAVGTPIVAVFGLSDPRRYGPLSPTSRIVRIDLPCSPCNRVRKPPARCARGTPDCLAGIGIDQVYRAAVELLRGSGRSPRQRAASTGAGR